MDQCGKEKVRAAISMEMSMNRPSFSLLWYEQIVNGLYLNSFSSLQQRLPCKVAPANKFTLLFLQMHSQFLL